MSLKSLLQYTKNLTLLYVEDDEDTRVSSLSVLKELFGDIVVGVDGNDGIDKFNSNHIDIIISDINMPHKDGLEMAKEIREIDKNIPILILSAHNEAQYFIESIKIGIDGYILKPMDISQFTQALSKSIDKIRLQQENTNFKEVLKSNTIGSNNSSNEEAIKQIDMMIEMMTKLKETLQAT